jgi:hypothetical protein
MWRLRGCEEGIEADLPPGLMTAPLAALPDPDYWIASAPNRSERVNGSPGAAGAGEVTSAGRGGSGTSKQFYACVLPMIAATFVSLLCA